MIVEKTAAKKSLALTLALSLGLSLPGSAAWSQTRGTRVVPVTANAAAASAASISVVRPISAALSGLSAPSLGAAVEAHPVIGLINQLQQAGVAMPETYSSYADAARIEAAAQVLPEGSSSRQQILQLAAAIRMSRAGGDGAETAPARVFDGSKDAVAAAEAVASAPETGARKTLELSADRVRYVPDAAKFPESSKQIPNDDKQIVGQDDALKAIRFGLEMKAEHYNLFVAGADGNGRSLALRHILAEIAPKMKTPNDLVAATNFVDKDAPIVLEFAPGNGSVFASGVASFVSALKEAIPEQIQGGQTAHKKQAFMDKVQAAAAKRQADFEAKVAAIRLGGGKFGASAKAAETPKGIQLSLAVTHEGVPVTKEAVAAKAAAGVFTEAEFAKAQAELAEKKGDILEAFQAMMSANLQQMQKAQEIAAKIDAQAVARVVTELADELAELAVNGPPTSEDEAFRERAQAREAELNEALQLFSRQTFGLFTVDVKVDMTGDGPIVGAVPVFNGQILTEAQIVADLVAAGRFTRQQFEEAASSIKRKTQALQDKMTEFVAATRKEEEVLQSKKPKPGPETERAVAYVQMMAQFAAANYKLFLGPIEETGDQSGLKPVPGSRPVDPQDFFRVSVLVDDAQQKGAPVIWEENPSYEGLFGSADRNERSMIIPGAGIVKTAAPGGPTLKGGSFLKANGGFLVLRAMDALRSPGVWPALMHAVRTGQAQIAEDGATGAEPRKINAYPVPGKVKVVLIGSPMIQMLLSKNDEDFAVNFQSLAQFQPTIKITEEAVGGFLNFLKHAVAGSAGEVMDLTRVAISRILEQAARLADSNQQFTSQFGALYGLLQEATYWAQKAGHDLMEASDVDAALAAKADREDVHYKRMSELYGQNIFRVETEGEAVGQINGLAVMGSHGVPMRITFVVGPGAPGIVSVDKDAGSTGPGFNKALGNEYSFMMHEFGQKKALRAQIRVSYEQNYGGIDGDSSTSTTLYGILSALSGVPISQKFAVTGSADQFGNVQAIGGVNEKIEGFFALCLRRGLTGDQGVIIPKTNVGNLQLSPEVAAAVKAGRFHIYPVKTVAQGMEILTGVDYQTIKEKAVARLDEFALAAK